MVYDLDGTLVDTLKDITIAANAMLATMGAPALTLEHVRSFVGRGMHELVMDCLQTTDPERVAEGLKIYRGYYGKHLADHSRLYPGALQTLEFFSHCAQAVITNKPNPYSTDLLTALGVAGFFTDIIGGEAPYPRKPDPASLLALLKKNQVSAREALMIGDSPIDVKTAQQAGVACVTLTHGLARRDEIMISRPDYIADSFEALLDLAKKQGWK